MIDQNLKELLGEELFAQVDAAIGANDQVNLVNATDGYRPKAEYDALQAQLTEQSATAAEESEELNTLKEKIALLEQEKTESDTAHQAELEALKKDQQIDRYLLDHDVRSLKAVSGFIDRTGVTLDESGTLTGLEEQLSAIREEAPYLFHETGPLTGPVNPVPQPKQPLDPKSSIVDKTNQLFNSND